MRAVGLAGSIAMVLSASALAKEPAVTPQSSSWGKPGVSFAQYRDDAVQCATIAANADVANTEAAKTLVTATRDLDRTSDLVSMAYTSGTSATTASGAVSNAGIYQHTIEKYRPDQQFAAIKAYQYALLENCLTSRGYVHFRLTKEQIVRVRHMKLGSDQRRDYLYRLSSDPTVVSAQRL